MVQHGEGNEGVGDLLGSVRHADSTSKAWHPRKHPDICGKQVFPARLSRISLAKKIPENSLHHVNSGLVYSRILKGWNACMDIGSGAGFLKAKRTRWGLLSFSPYPRTFFQKMFWYGVGALPLRGTGSQSLLAVKPCCALL